MKNIFQMILICSGLLLSQTAEQIKKAKEIIQKSGMSESQAKATARAQGYTDKQIDDAAKKMKASKKNPTTSIFESSKEVELPKLGKSNEIDQAESLDGSITVEQFSSNSEDDLEIIDESRIDFESEPQPGRRTLNYFGYDIFKRDPALFQATSVGAVDPDYLIGPGDEIIVMLWGETQFRQVLTVDREGFVFIPEIGQVFVNGLNLSLLESKLFRVFSQSYASLNPQNRTPTTFLDVSLGNLRPLRIQVLGEVAQPGAYTVSPSATLFSALYYFNGPTTLGSLRDVQLIRAGEKVASIDFYDFLLTGKKPKDQKLQLDDVIFIPRRQKTVHIEGEINREGIFELKPDENLADFISIAGDFKITAYLDRAQIDRIVPFKDRQDIGMDRMVTDVNLDKILSSEIDFPLQDGDRIQIFSVLDNRQNIVELQGSVTRPGSYDLGDSLKLSELIAKADGILGDAYLDRADIIRIKPDFTEELIKINLGEALNKNLDQDKVLQGLDRVRIYGITEMVPRTYVSILGHVKRPGRYLLRENMTLYDLIFKAGGFVDEEFRKKTFLERADLLRMNKDNVTRSIKTFNLGELLSAPKSGADVPLQANDMVRIYEKSIFMNDKSITINGVVRRPGTYKLKTEMSIKDLILEAGGTMEDVYRYRVEVARIDPLNKSLEKYAEIITFNVDEKFSISPGSLDGLMGQKDSSSAMVFQLKPYDLVSIRPDPYFNNQKRVLISGQVLYPGEYTILKPDEKITDIIKRAGGLLNNAYANASSFIRNGEKVNVSYEEILKNPKSKLNFNMQNGDQIIINSYPNIVKVIGSVNRPGVQKYVFGKRLRYYINTSGGMNPDADIGNIWVDYPNGISKKYSKWSLLSPKIMDGSFITVGKKKEEEPFDRTEFAKEVTAILANLAQAISLIYLATNQ